MADDIFSLLGGAKPKAKAKAKAATKAKAKPKAAIKSTAFTQGVAAGLKGSPPTGKTPDWLNGYIQGSKARKAGGSAVAKPKAKAKPSAGTLTISKVKPKAKLKPGAVALAKPKAKAPSAFKKFWESGVKPSTPPVGNGSQAFTQGVAAGMKGNSPPTGKPPDWLEGYIQGSKARIATTKAALQRDERIKAELQALTSSKAKQPEAKAPSAFKKFWGSGVKPSTPPVKNGVKGTTHRPPWMAALATRVAKRVEPQRKTLSEPEFNKLTAQVASRMEPRHATLSEAQLSMFAAKVVDACNESHKRPRQANGELQGAIQDYKQTSDAPQGKKTSAEKLMGYRSAIKQKASTLRKGRGGIVR